ncbi:MAG TPA: PHP domain-containing protein [Anaerolineales bacterium]
MITVEFHCHTWYSHDSLVRLPQLLATCRKKGLQHLAITDHNTIQGALEAVALDPHTFIAGEEILTLQGELLAYFVKELVPAGLPASETINLLRQQGVFISVAHPFDTLRKGHWTLDDLLEITPYVDAIEVFNSRCIAAQANQQAAEFAQEHHLLATVGSDAHSLGEVAAASLFLPEFHDALSLKQALAQAQKHVRLSSPWVHFYSRYAAWRKKM